MWQCTAFSTIELVVVRGWPSHQLGGLLACPKIAPLLFGMGLSGRGVRLLAAAPLRYGHHSVAVCRAHLRIPPTAG